MTGRRVARQASIRSAGGMYMLEMILAITTTGMIMLALVEGLAEAQRLSSSSQNQILAASIAQQQIDNTRNCSYGNLVPGSYTLLVNRTISGQVGPNVNPRPVLLDLVNLSWSASSQGNPFNPTVVEQITDDSSNFPNTMMVTITVTWNEGANGNRSYTLSTLVSQYGIHI